MVHKSYSSGFGSFPNKINNEKYKCKGEKMIPYEIGKKIIDLIEKELGGKTNGHDEYLEGKGTQFSFDLDGKSYSVDLWDESIIDSFNQ